MDNILNFAWSVMYIIIYIFMLVFLIQKKEMNIFVRGLFIVGVSFGIYTSIIEILTYNLSIEFFKNNIGWGGDLGFILHFPNMTKYFLLILGISLLVGKDHYTNMDSNNNIQNLDGKRRSVGVSLLLFIVTLGIYFYFWLYRTVKDLKNNFETDIPYTPGKAVGFLFIPVFNVFWFIYILFSLPLNIKRIEKKYYAENVGFHFHPIFISVLILVFVILSYFGLLEERISDMIGSLLFFETAIIILWLTIQAKLNSFFEFKDNSKSLENA